MNVYKFDKERELRRKQAEEETPRGPKEPPVFNLPDVILWTAGAMIAIHLVRWLVLSDGWDGRLLVFFGFWPVRYLPEAWGALSPLGLLSNLWAFVTYSLLHGSATHIIFNLLWMAIFGSALARRFGAMRFLLFSALCSVGGAFAHLATHYGEAAPMIGASAAVSGQMAGAIRFVFELGGPLGAFRRSDTAAYFVPARPLAECFQNRQVLVFVGIWFALNLLFGLMSGPVAGQAATIAWQAHIGGFVAGLALFPFLDPVRQRH